MERLFLLTARSRNFPTWARCALTTVMVFVSFAGRLVLFGPGPGMPFLLFFPAVILAGVVFDRGTGIYAAVLSSVMATYFFVEPIDSLRVAGTSDLLALLVFLGTSLFSAFVLEALHALLERALAQQADLAAAMSDLRRVADEKGTLLSEAVHRARNDLQRLSATIRMQARGAGSAEARDALLEATDRITGLARINERLDRHRDDGHAEVDSRGYVEGLAEDLRTTAIGLRPVALSMLAEAHAMPMERAVPVGLVINELVGNALKYGFPDDIEGQIKVGFRRAGAEFVLVVEDNGVGFNPGAPPRGSGLGGKLCRAFAAQLGGKLDVGPALEGSNRPGTRWTMRFPVGGTP